MDFADKIKAIAASIPKQREHLDTEEATKHALVMPFIQALGYNIFDPTEVRPEFTSDVGTKRGEKIDYAIFHGDHPAILLECKWHGANLDKETPTQLYRYFSVSEARFAVLTNGIVYRFFTDLEEQNKLDAKPFLEFDMLNPKDALVDELKKFSKAAFDVDRILATASELKYMREVKRLLAVESSAPSEEFVRYFAAQVYPGKLTQSVRQQFAELVRRAFQQFISERVADRLKSALAEETAAEADAGAAASPGLEQGEPVDTTPDELQAWLIVKAIVGNVTGTKRITIRDQKTYCAILFDDNNRKPICRLWFNSAQKYIGVFDEAKKESRIPIADLDSIYDCADMLRATAQRYISGN